MKRRAFLLRSGAGLAAAALPALSRPSVAADAGDAHHDTALAGIAQLTWMDANRGVVLRNNTLRNNVLAD